MNYVAIDTSGKNLTIIAKFNGEIFSYFNADCGVNHSVSVMTELENLLNSAKMKLSDADFFACVVGAGSFTGIRIGVSTVKALAYANKKPVLSITSFDTLAYNIDSGKVLAIIDAKHDGYYVCAYNNGVAETAEYIAGAELSKYKQYKFISFEKIDGIKTEIVSVKDGLIRAIENKESELSNDINSLKPLYIRKSQAEEGR